MYRVLLAEEDMSSMSYLEEILENNFKSLEIIDRIQSGRETIEKMKELNPDILLIAVRLKGINGLEAIKSIRKFNKKVHIYIISAYDYYEFLKEAIRCDVDEYILKPINRRDFVIGMERTIEKIDNERRRHKEEKQLRKTMESSLEFTEYCLVYSVLFNSGGNSRLEELKTVLDLGDYACVLNLEFGEDITREKRDKKRENNIVYTLLKSMIRPYYKCVIGPKIFNRIVVAVFAENSDVKEYEFADQMNALCELIRKRLKRELNVDIKAGIGKKRRLESLHKSYEEALRSLRSVSGKNIVYVEDLKADEPSKQGNYIDLEKKLIESVSYGKEEAVEYFTTILQTMDNYTEQDKRSRIIELLILCCHGVRTAGQNETELLNYTGYFSEMMQVEEKNLNSWAYKCFQCILKAAQLKKGGQLSAIIENAVSYMESHYKEELFLDEVAQNAGVTPQYFSRLFKEETGVNFVEWIGKIRIDRAKKLMREQEMTIKEISYYVGYNDPNYFSRIFKKFEGISPTEYVRQLNSENKREDTEE